MNQVKKIANQIVDLAMKTEDAQTKEGCLKWLQFADLEPHDFQSLLDVCMFENDRLASELLRIYHEKYEAGEFVS